MKFDDFINRLYECGWGEPETMQWGKFRKLHAEIFPHSARMEKEITKLEKELARRDGDLYEEPH